MGAQPTLWQWITFFLSLALMGYAGWLVMSSRFPSSARVSQPRRRRSARWYWLTFVDVVGGWFLAIFEAIWRAIRGLVAALWSGPRREPEPAPVSRVSVGLPAAYVTGPGHGSPQSAPSGPSAVRPSASSAVDRPVSPAVPAAVERLTVDRSREALVEALVAAGWSTTQIRSHLSGANDAIGREVEAARARLTSPRETPIAGRPTAARFHGEGEPA